MNKKKLRLSRKTIKTLTGAQVEHAVGGQSRREDGCWGDNSNQTCYQGCSQYCVGTYYCATYGCTPPPPGPPSIFVVTCP